MTEAPVSKDLMHTHDQIGEAEYLPIASHISLTSLLPVLCFPATVIGFLGGKLNTSPFFERCSRLALLETTGHNPSILLVSGFSMTLPSQIQKILFPCSFSFFTSLSASSSR